MLTGIWKIVFEEDSPLDLDALHEAHLDLVMNGLRYRD